MRLLILAVLIPSVAFAQAAPPKGWGGAIDLGFVSSRGNSNLTSFSLGERLGWKATKRVNVAQSLHSIYGKIDDSVTANSLAADLKADYAIIDGAGLTVGGAYERNRFSGIDQRLEEAFGLAWRFSPSHVDSLRLETAVVWTQERNLQDAENDYTSVRLALWYKRQIRSASYFQETFEALPNLDNHDDWRINSESAIVAPISKRIGLKVAYVLHYDNLPEPTFKTTDTILTAGVQISY